MRMSLPWYTVFHGKRLMNRLKAANAITSSRIVFALLILFAPVFSVPFYVFYFLGAATDMADGIIARKLNQESSFGAKLDTVADLVFVIAVLIKIVMNVMVPTWLWIWTAIIALIKLINLISGFVVCRKFVAVHSIMNKITGGIMFCLPLFIGLKLPLEVISGICIIACAAATFAAIQEGHYIRTGKVTEQQIRNER